MPAYKYNEVDAQPWLTYTEEKGATFPDGDIEITENGTYDVTKYASAIVDVAGVQPTGTLTITENDTYDVTEYASAVVDVDTSEDVLEGLIEGYLQTLIIPTETTLIGKYALYKQVYLVNVTVPNITSINEHAFADCTSLANINFPNSLINIAGSAFSGCSSLETDIDIPNLIQLNSNCFYGCSKIKKVSLPKLTTTGTSNFQNCTMLESADLGLITTIKASTFTNCYSLTELVLRNTSVVSIDNTSAFSSTPFRGYNGGIGTVYVPSDLISSYQAATIWKSYYTASTTVFVALEGSKYE